jgi:hypothetical protein
LKLSSLKLSIVQSVEEGELKLIPKEDWKCENRGAITSRACTSDSRHSLAGCSWTIRIIQRLTYKQVICYLSSVHNITQQPHNEASHGNAGAPDRQGAEGGRGLLTKHKRRRKGAHNAADTMIALLIRAARMVTGIPHGTDGE